LNSPLDAALPEGEADPIPSFSVVMPALNAAAFIAEAMRSVLAQSFADWELIVVDDGSHDGTLDVVHEIASEDPRIMVLQEERPKEQRARITAAARARAPWLVRLDADDMMESGYLERMWMFMRANPGYDIYSCNAVVFGPVPSRLFHREPAFRQPRSTSLDEMLMNGAPIFGMAVFRRQAYEEVGGYRETAYAGDYDLWLRLLARGARHLYNPEVLGRYRLTEAQMSKNRIRINESFLETVRNVAAGPDLTDAQRAIAAARIRSLEGRIRRLLMEVRLENADFGGVRGEYWRCRAGYGSAFKYYSAGALLCVSPRLYWLLHASLRRP